MRLEELSAKEIGTLVNNKELKVSEVLDYFFNRICLHNKVINAFVYTKYEEALEEAENLQKKINRGEAVGSFAGVPFALKDFLPAGKPGWQHSYGGVQCMIGSDSVYSEFCKGMLKLGGVPLGKTNAPAFGFKGVTDNKLYGTTNNPFNTEYNSGGSSGGSAAAVASGLIPIAEGGDAGGSIRIPAAWCNLYGFKPGVGTVPSVCRPDAWSATHPFCFNFALTKTVDDAAILLNAMAYYNPYDPFSRVRVEKDFTQLSEFKRFNIAFTEDFGLFPIDREVAGLIQNFSSKISKIYNVVSYTFNFKSAIEDFSEAWCKSLIFDSVIELELLKRQTGVDLVNQYADQFPEELPYWIEKGKTTTIWDTYRFNLLRTEILDNFEQCFEHNDFIMSPVSCCLPIKNNKIDGHIVGIDKINETSIDPLIGWSMTYLVNFTGHPAVSIPIGLSKQGLPIGVQIIGKIGSEKDLLLFSKFIENNYPWKQFYKQSYFS